MLRGVFTRTLAVVVALAAAWFSTERASAAFITFDSDVNLVAGASVGSTILGSSTPVHIHGTFDTTVLNDFGGFFATYPFITLTFDVSGVGVFSAAVPSDFDVFAVDSSIFGAPAIGISDFFANAGYFSLYGTTTNPYVYNALTPNKFGAFAGTGLNPLVIPLANGAGDLTLIVDDSVPTSTVLGQVPEPSTSAIFAVFGVVAIVGGAYRRRRNVVARDC